MSPTLRAAVLAGTAAPAVLVVPPGVVLLLLVGLAAFVIVDGFAARRAPEVERQLPSIVARGVPSEAVLVTSAPRVRLRQPVPADVVIEPAEADGRLTGVLVARRRGRHQLPPSAVRTTGPLGLARVDRTVGGPTELVAYPDLPAARAIAARVRQGRVGEGRRRGALGIGTDFESLREYAPDDDVRQVNWRATARVGRPMTNQYRIDQDRDVLCLVDAGRLMGAPLADRTRLDAALDAVTAVALVADVVGDRCGALAFDASVLRRVTPRRTNGRAVIDALFDLEPSVLDSDYDQAFRTLGAKRACVVVLTDLVEPAAARPLLEAVPTLARRHAVIVASVRDTDLEGLVSREPASPLDTYAAAVAVEVLGARALAARQLRHAGALVVEASPDRLGAACVDAYLRIKSRGLA